MSKQVSIWEAENRCRSAGCYIAREELGRSAARRSKKFFKKYRAPQFLTIIPFDGLVEFEKVDEFGLKAFTIRNQKKLARCLPKGVILMGSADVCLNVFENEAVGWCFHIHAMISRPLTDKELRKLKAQFPRDCSLDIYRPVVQIPIARKELRSTARYVCKSCYTRRSSYIAEPKSGRKPYRSSRSEALTVKEKAMLNAALAKYRVSDLLIFVGLKRQRTSDPTKLRLVRTSR